MTEPINRYEFCTEFDRITKSPKGRFLGETRGWKDDEVTFRTLNDLWSEAKQSKNPAATVNNWFKKFRESKHEI